MIEGLLEHMFVYTATPSSITQSLGNERWLCGQCDRCPHPARPQKQQARSYERTADVSANRSVRMRERTIDQCFRRLSIYINVHSVHRKHQKEKIRSSCTHPHVSINLYVSFLPLNTREDTLKNEGNQTVDDLVQKNILCQSNNCLVNHIIQHAFLCSNNDETVPLSAIFCVNHPLFEHKLSHLQSFHGGIWSSAIHWKMKVLEKPVWKQASFCSCLMENLHI